MNEEKKHPEFGQANKDAVGSAIGDQNSGEVASNTEWFFLKRLRAESSLKVPKQKKESPPQPSPVVIEFEKNT